MLVGGQLRRILPCIDTVIEPLDKFQVHILRELGVTVEEAFLQFNAAPLRIRRDIAMLALIFKCAHGLAHENLQEKFPSDAPGWLIGRVTVLRSVAVIIRLATVLIIVLTMISGIQDFGWGAILGRVMVVTVLIRVATVFIGVATRI